MCRVLKVARAGFYVWLHNPVSAGEKDNQRLLELIRDSYTLSGGVYGYRRVHGDLREIGEVCSRNRVAKIMRKNGTVAKLAMRQPFVLFKGLTFQKLCLPGAFRPGDHHNKMLRPGHCCKVSDEAAFCLIQRPYISKTLLTRRISPRGSP